MPANNGSHEYKKFWGSEDLFKESISTLHGKQQTVREVDSATESTTAHRRDTGHS